jgi:hypothetical protein
MHWRYAGMGMFALMMMTGCPSEFGKDGRIAKAIHQDSMELVRRNCSVEERRAVCEGPNKDPAACQECGG